GAFAAVKVEGEPSPVLVSITSGKPAISGRILDRWQGIVDLVARIMRVPTGLITRFTEENLEILVASRGAGNPYKRDDRDRLGIGMFCETVAGRRREMRVDDSSASSYWAANPHAALGMRSYLGVPIAWEDGELFGTFCMLNDRANAFEDEYLELMRQFKEIIESDLRCLLLQDELERRLSAKELELRETRHRLKNQLNLLISYIRIRASSSSDPGTKELLKEIQHRVFAVSAIHEALYKGSSASAPTLDLYLRQLCGHIIGDLSEGEIEQAYDIEPLVLAPERLLPIALIVAELLTNTLKHAFPEGGKRRVSLRAARLPDGRLSLEYRDNGVGLPPSFDLASAKSLGSVLLRALAGQLSGEAKAESAEGARFSFSFGI
ncbi:MAG TPA: histidine kinase dimerization/phosphoacceptor domain -containing protein, partial [Spirochaetales bacterium]|nr:histidine kinase dimerization/phosphoacceptor domain -containing protein [Spirochaetales bacterium]